MANRLSTSAEKSEAAMERSIATASTAVAEMAKTYQEEPRVVVSIAPLYAPYFGNKMPVVLNSVPIYVPCDGRQYEIPESYAQEVQARLARVNDQIRRETRLSNVQANFDGNTPGGNDLLKLVQ